MAQIDLKFATVSFVDGFAATAAINNATPYTTGAVTMTIDSYAGVLSVGDVFTVAGETTATTEHTITAHTETTGSTTSITFTPALGAGTYADNGVLTFKPHSILATLGEGNLTYTEKRNMEYKLNQGRIKWVRLGDEVPMDISLDFAWEFLTAASTDVIPTIEDVLKQRGLASNWVTTGLDPCEPYCLNLVLVYTPPCPGVESETINLIYFRYEELEHSAKDATVSVKGKSNALFATVTRSAA